MGAEQHNLFAVITRTAVERPAQPFLRLTNGQVVTFGQMLDHSARVTASTSARVTPSFQVKITACVTTDILPRRKPRPPLPSHRDRADIWMGGFTTGYTEPSSRRDPVSNETYLSLRTSSTFA